MGYKDRLQTASFRNVSFFVDTHTFEGGRRIVTHEFPERDEPASEDMGRRARSFSLEAHIVDGDYFGQRDRLIRALEKKNFGVLIHPFLGRKEVRCTGFSVTESTREGRIAQFTLNFIERGRSINPIGIFGKVFGVFDQINDTLDDIQEKFEEIYQVALLPGYVADSAIGVLNNVADTFTEAIGIVPATTSAIDQVKNNILDYANLIPTTVSDSTEIFTSTVTLQKELTQITNDSRDKQLIQEYLLDFGDDAMDPPILTPSREQEVENNEGIYEIVQGTAVTQIVSWFVQSVTEPFDVTVDEFRNLENNTIFSIGDLQTRRDEIVDIIDNHIEKFPTSDATNSFISLKGKMLNALPADETSTDLRREQALILNDTLPMLYIVYDQFENLKSERDFIKRNNIEHPAFVKGGVEYEIVEIE